MSLIMLRKLVVLLLILSVSMVLADSVKPIEGKAEGETSWYDLQQLGIEGQGWKEVRSPYDRLPAKAEKVVRRAVWNLSRHAAGLHVRFRTDATALQARWTLTGARLQLPHMPATAVSGLDLYVRGPSGSWQWLAVGQPTGQKNSVELVKGLPGGKVREFLLYLPLYNGVSQVEIGLPRGARLQKAGAYPGYKKPIVVYGTSIVQGGCASRAGMVHTSILHRILDWPVINLGFSGNGKMEPELAELLGELDASLYILDCLPNLTAEEVEKRVEPFVQRLRKARPETPILLMEDRSYTDSANLPARRERNQRSRAALRRAWEKMVWEGVQSLQYLGGEELLGHDGEGTVDGSHPNDLGFMRQARAMESMVRYCLPGPEGPRRVLEAYTDQLSYLPGETVKVHAACETGAFRYQIVREGAKRRVVAQGNGKAKAYPIPKDASSQGCRWPVSFTFKIPEQLESGYYQIELETSLEGGSVARGGCFFVVRSVNPGKETKVLLQLATNTYNAYTNWGGIQSVCLPWEEPSAGATRIVSEAVDESVSQLGVAFCGMGREGGISDRPGGEQ